MTFDYLYVEQAQGQIDIEDVGNVILSAIGTMYTEYILWIKTEWGRTKVLTYGPRIADKCDIDVPLNYVNCNYQEFDFSMGKLEGIIDKFINNPKCNVMQVIQIQEEEAREKIKDLVSFL